MKKVLDMDMVAHLFAHQSQDYATTPTRSMYFREDTIYSYGSHFPIAKHITNDKGETCVLFTTRSYSNTTAKHISVTRSACNHLNIIYCENPESSKEQNLKSYEEKIKSILSGLAKAKKKEKYIEPAKDVFNDAKRYCEFFSIDVPKNIMKLIKTAENGDYLEYLQKEKIRLDEEKKAEEKKKLRQFKIKLNKWRKNESDRVYDRVTGFDYLRCNEKGRIETSQGVEIPINVAKQTFSFIVQKVKAGGDNNPNFRILNWNLEEITPDFIKIGCHKIAITEINQMAKQMKWA